MNAFELMNFLSSCLINRIFDVEMNKELQSSATPLNISKELSVETSQRKTDSSEVSKKIELCQQFTVTRNLKEIYDMVNQYSFKNVKIIIFSL